MRLSREYTVITAKKSKKKNNPWAICTNSVGREDKDKYEQCVMDVKRKNKAK